MHREYHNICRIGRLRAGMTQEQWAEAVGVSVRGVGAYEAGDKRPSDEVALRMAEVADYPVLCYWHMRSALSYAPGLLPEVEEVSLPQAVVTLLKELRDLDRKNVTDKLLDMADDGVIDLNERPTYDAVIKELRDVIHAAVLLTYADAEGRVGC